MDLVCGGASLPLAAVVKACGMFRWGDSGEAGGSGSASVPGATASVEAEGSGVVAVLGSSGDVWSGSVVPVDAIVRGASVRFVALLGIIIGCISGFFCWARC